MSSPVPISRPPKRTLVDVDESNITPSHYPSTSQVKSERSPSPLLVEKRLVTSGAKRFAPIPNDCLPSCTDYKRNRLEWVARCVKELEALSLMPERRLFRDDGLVIDWRSHVPVWSNTLRPDPQDLAATITLAHRSNAQWRHSPRKESPLRSVTTSTAQERLTLSPPVLNDASDAEPPSKKRIPVPPRPSSRRSLMSGNQPQRRMESFSPRSERSQLLGRETCSPNSHLEQNPIQVHIGRPADCSRGHAHGLSNPIPIPSDVSSQRSQIGTPPKPPRSAFGQPVASGTPSAAEDEMSEMTLNYLRRYIQSYESDRASLASVYSSKASFAYRVHHMVQNMDGRPPSVSAASLQCSSSGAKRTRLDIVTTLLTLPRLHSNAPNSAVAQIEYDIFYLGPRLGMFVVCRTVDSNKTVVHNFILQRKEMDVEDAVVEGIWPLTATAHQILVFQS